MSAAQPMPSARRRQIPGMASQPIAPPSPAPARREADHHVDDDAPAREPEASTTSMTEANDVAPVRSDGRRRAAREPEIERAPAADYTSTRLVNFRIAVDVHERFRGLVREAEIRQPRLRRPSLTELVIALLEEGPQTADEVAELIRRKRAARGGWKCMPRTTPLPEREWLSWTKSMSIPNSRNTERR
jgi:hypothetical protein